MKKSHRQDNGVKYVVCACACLFTAGVFIGMATIKQTSNKTTVVLAASLSQMQSDLVDTKQVALGAGQEVAQLRESVKRFAIIPSIQIRDVPTAVAPAIVIEASKVGLPQRSGSSGSATQEPSKNQSRVITKREQDQSNIDLQNESLATSSSKVETKLTLFDPASGALRLSPMGR